MGFFDGDEKPAIREPGENKYAAYDEAAAEKKLGL